MATGFITKKRNNYYCVIPVGKKQKWKAAGTSRRKAEKKLAELMHQVHRGEYVEMQEATFEEFANKWLKDYAKPKVRISTYEFYESLLRVHLVPFFGDFKLTAIKPHLVQEFLAKKIEEDKLSLTTIGYSLRVLRTILKRAMIWGFVTSNAAEHIEKPRVAKKEMDCLSAEEINAFLEHVKPPYYALFLLAARSGMRRAEVLGLVWKDILFDSNQVFVHRSLFRGQLVEPKSRSSRRRVILPSAAMKVLRKHRLSSSYSSEEDMVFCNREGRALDPNNLVKREFLPALKRAGVRRTTFHSLRHSYASIMLASGEDLLFVSRQLGHSNATITLNRYSHVMPHVENGAAERLEKVFTA